MGVRAGSGRHAEREKRERERGREWRAGREGAALPLRALQPSSAQRTWLRKGATFSGVKVMVLPSNKPRVPPTNPKSVLPGAITARASSTPATTLWPPGHWRPQNTMPTRKGLEGVGVPTPESPGTNFTVEVDRVLGSHWASKGSTGAGLGTVTARAAPLLKHLGKGA
jgi:hypothetical protein